MSICNRLSMVPEEVVVLAVIGQCPDNGNLFDVAITLKYMTGDAKLSGTPRDTYRIHLRDHILRPRVVVRGSPIVSVRSLEQESSDLPGRLYQIVDVAKSNEGLRATFSFDVPIITPLSSDLCLKRVGCPYVSQVGVDERCNVNGAPSLSCTRAQQREKGGSVGRDIVIVGKVCV